MENNNLKDNTNFVLHFYDWYGNRTKVPTNSEKWTHKVDWNSLGLREEEICDSEKYY